MEGFGLPAVEAAACGCPVIATTNSPLPRLLAGGGIFIEPVQAEIERALTQLLGSSAEAARLGARNLECASRLTWNSAATQMMEVFRAIA
jgi:glycosyltransferase involved in cell wall biosynthesis